MMASTEMKINGPELQRLHKCTQITLKNNVERDKQVAEEYVQYDFIYTKIINSQN